MGDVRQPHSAPPTGGLTSLLVQWLEPLSACLWTFFLVWSLIVAAVWGLGIGPVELTAGKGYADLRRALLWLVPLLDPIWVVLAATIAYRATMSAEGLSVTRKWALSGMLVIYAILWLSAHYGWPLGPVHFTHRLGSRLGPVPIVLVLFVLSLVWSARSLIGKLLPKASHLQVAAATAAICTLTLLNLDPLAWKFRSWWLWYPADLSPHSSWPPFSSSLTWLIASALIAWLMRSTRISPRPSPRLWELHSLILVFNSVFLLTHLAHWLRN